jgi:hypothetical protein
MESEIHYAAAMLLRVGDKIREQNQAVRQAATAVCDAE